MRLLKSVRSGTGAWADLDWTSTMAGASPRVRRTKHRTASLSLLVAYFSWRLMVLVPGGQELELKFIDTCHNDPAYSEVRTDIC